MQKCMLLAVDVNLGDEDETAVDPTDDDRNLWGISDPRECKICEHSDAQVLPGDKIPR